MTDHMQLTSREQRIVLLYFHDSDRLTDTEYYDAVRILRIQDALIGWISEPNRKDQTDA